MTSADVSSSQEFLRPIHLPIPGMLTPEELVTIQDDPIILANAESLQGNEFNKIAITESMGGNAGTVEIEGHKYSCIGINGYADRETGHIIAFSNHPNNDPDLGHFLYKIAAWSITAPENPMVFINLFHEGRISPDGLVKLVQGAALRNHESAQLKG